MVERSQWPEGGPERARCGRLRPGLLERERTVPDRVHWRARTPGGQRPKERTSGTCGRCLTTKKTVDDERTVDQ